MKRIIFTLLTISTLALAQEPVQNRVPNTGWRRFSEAPYGGPSAAVALPAPMPAYEQQQQQPPPPLQQQPPQQQQGNQPPFPSQLTIRPGTYITVRVDQPLSSDHNQQGDAFSATLVRPVVVDGIVVAQRGQALGGRVAEAQKAGRVQGLSRLALQITDISLVDGQQLPIQAQLISRVGSTSEGRDAGAIAGTTAAGAAIGAGVNGGVGAGVGAGIGALTGIAGVLLTRGRSTEIYPETVLTFRIDAPVTFSTERSGNSFREVEPGDYDRAAQETRMQVRRPAPPPVRPYYYGGYYGYDPFFYGYGWGPSFGFRFYSGPRSFYGRGYYRRR